jgi:hypothetical protein
VGLQESYKRYFRKEQEAPPQFKKKSRSRIRVTETDASTFEIDDRNQRLKFPKLAWTKCRYPRKIEGHPNAVTIRSRRSIDRCG